MFGSSIFIAKDNNIIIGAHSNNNVHGNVIILCTCTQWEYKNGAWVWVGAGAGARTIVFVSIVLVIIIIIWKMGWLVVVPSLEFIVNAFFFLLWFINFFRRWCPHFLNHLMWRISFFWSQSTSFIVHFLIYVNLTAFMVFIFIVLLFIFVFSFCLLVQSKYNACL